MKRDHVDWLESWFKRHAANPTLEVEELAESNFFEVGLIDSFGVLELIEDLEARFGIRFTERDFQDRRFSTISGLAEMVEEMRNREGLE